MKNYIFYLLGIISVLLIQCAQPKGLTGGQKDTQPPKVLKLSPQNLTTNFSGQTIAMEFDEYVEVKSLASELVVSPPLQYPMEYRLKGKRVFFDLQDTLIPNTTYNFNFGNAIVDLNEGNPLDSNLFVFSTGDLIDSGYIYGTVYDAYTQSPVKNVKVVLYKSVLDSAVYQGDPIYVTQTNASGQYELRFLGENTYHIYALTSPGENFKYVPQTTIGFNKEVVDPYGENNIVDLFLFKEVDSTQFISKESSKEYFWFTIGFNTDLQKPTFQFEPKNDSLNYIIEEIRQDSFKFWLVGDHDIDSVQVFITDQTGYQDTAKVDLAERKMFFKKLKRKKVTTSPVVVRLGTKNGVHHYFDTLRLNFSRPIQEWRVDSMHFVINDDTIPLSEAMSKNILKIQLSEKHLGTSKELRSVALTHGWKPSTNYAFIFNSGSFVDIINQTNDTTILKFKTINFEDYGSFRFTVQVPEYEGPLLLELLDNKGKFLRDYKIKSGDVIYHELAVPGTYKFRLILDENGNNKWDSGNLTEEIQPEKIVYYSGSVEIRSNWDMEETWQVDVK